MGDGGKDGKEDVRNKLFEALEKNLLDQIELVNDPLTVGGDIFFK